jgi:hypothetical protein
MTTRICAISRWNRRWHLATPVERVTIVITAIDFS